MTPISWFFYRETAITAIHTCIITCVWGVLGGFQFGFVGSFLVIFLLSTPVGICLHVRRIYKEWRNGKNYQKPTFDPRLIEAQRRWRENDRRHHKP